MSSSGGGAIIPHKSVVEPAKEPQRKKGKKQAAKRKSRRKPSGIKTI